MSERPKYVIVGAVVALGLLGAIFVVIGTRPKTPIEVARLSQNLVSARVRAFYDHPDLARLEEVRRAVADHQQDLKRSDLPADVREAMARDLFEYVAVAQGIATKDPVLRERAWGLRDTSPALGATRAR